MRNAQGIIITSLSFIVGMGEALVYYNMGQAEGKKFDYKLPPRKQLLQTAGVVLLTSILTAVLFKGVESGLAYLNSEEEEEPNLA